MSPVKELEFYISLGLTTQQILDVFRESEQFHKDWERDHPTDWAAMAEQEKELHRCKVC